MRMRRVYTRVIVVTGIPVRCASLESLLLDLTEVVRKYDKRERPAKLYHIQQPHHRSLSIFIVGGVYKGGLGHAGPPPDFPRASLVRAEL